MCITTTLPSTSESDHHMILYLDCAMGASGDMLTGALLELTDDKDTFLATMNSLLLGVTLAVERTRRGAIAGTRVTVGVHGTVEGYAHDAHSLSDSPDRDSPHHHVATHHHDVLPVRDTNPLSVEEDASPDHVVSPNHDHQPKHHRGHTHTSLTSIRATIDALPVSPAVRSHATAVYAAIAGAESRVHGVPVTDIHFHEVGRLDAIADIVGVCLLLETLAPDKVVCSPVHVGGGYIPTAHGLLPVPAPATAELLRGIPVLGGPVDAELCTPTGAALLSHFVTSFGPVPPMTIEKTGYGLGAKDFPEAPNCLRAFLGHESPTPLSRRRDTTGPNDTISELSCNLDDITGEEIAYAAERLFAAGALDVTTTPIIMKKGRPGLTLTCLARPEDADALARTMLRHTTTYGVRVASLDRYILDRTTMTRLTADGPMRVKFGSGYGIHKEKYEYDDVAALALAQDRTLTDVLETVRNEKDDHQ